ncbi:MAG: hypothetical protein HW382_420 [Deltaproteobacteria bacterium]|nr:hypothetical protein [Deltaproteobacteria bacterium]MBM2837569.1 hypothetical protein [Deltaproteobacteria bacterium]
MKLKNNNRHCKCVAIMLSCLLAVSTFTPLTGQARAADDLHAIGHIFASEGAKLRLPSGDWIDLGKTSVPLFSASRIKTEKGSIYINLASAGIIEAPRDSEFHIARTEEGITLNLQKGGASFSISGSVNFSVITPIVTIKGASQTAALKSVASSREMGGVVVINDNSVLVRATKGDMTVLTVDGKGSVVKSGEAIRVAELKPKTPSSPAGVPAAPAKGLIDKTAAVLGVSKGAATVIMAVAATGVVAGGAVAMSGGGGDGGGSICQ